MREVEFGQMADGRKLHAWHMGGAGELSAVILTYGARIARLEVPTPRGPASVSLSLPSPAAWLADHSHLGAVAGRYANRIAGGRFTLDGRVYELPRNNGGNTLHGGPAGFGVLPWEAEPDGDALRLRLHSPDGDQGFPGALDVQVGYAIRGLDLVIDYTATTTSPTVLNLTNHCYFNLDGAPKIEGHVLRLIADHFLPTTADFIPTGERRAVDGTPFDFRTPTPIGARIGDPDPQLTGPGGYDHNFILADAPRETPALAAEVSAGDLTLQVLTTEPGIQLYTGNFLSGTPHGHRSGFCLETQHFPDSPNHPGFPSTVLRPGHTARSRTIFRFVV